MEYIYSPMSKPAYLAALRQKFDSPLRFYDERVTGVVIGSFFSVAHYQEYEWNRRITSECNRAFGFVKQTHGELEIRFVRGKGLLAPGWFSVLLLLCRLFFLVAEIRAEQRLGVIAWVCSAAIALVVCVISALHSSITDKGAAGAYQIDKFLEDPENYYC